MIWKLKKGVNPFAIKRYQDDLGVSKPMAEILLSNGISKLSAWKLLKAPEQMFNMEDYVNGMVDTVQSIIAYMKQKEHFYIFADYDVDGFSSGYILYSYLKNKDVDVTIKFPTRNEGYGINLKWCKSVPKENSIVITIDNGITAIEPIAYLKEQGIPVIVIDHHEPAEELPPATIICDAFLDNEYGTHLCAGALAWKIVTFIEWGLSDDTSKAQEVCQQYIPYAALATIADVMPSCNENRAIIQAGLNAINKKQSRVLDSFMNSQSIETMRSKDIAWTVAPSLNACSRMNNMELAEEFFLSEDDPKKDLTSTISEIKRLNERRKKETQDAIDNIIANNDFSNSPVCFIDATNYSTGLLGILAGKISELTGKPAIAYQSDENNIGRGSARGINVYDIINYEAQKDNAIGALGHLDACGAIIRTDKIEEFNQDLLDSGLIQTIEENIIEKAVELNAVITPDDLNYAIRLEINSFGYTSSEIPLIGILDVEVEPVLWETKAGKKHILFKMKDSKKKEKYAIYWNGYDEYINMGSPKRINIAGTLDNGGFCRWFKGARLSENSTMLTIDVMEGAN